MCTCASCEYTDRFGGMPDLLGAPIRMDHKHGWDYWPRGDPAGKRGSERDYAAHVAHSRVGAARSVPFTPGQPPQFPAWMRGNGPIQPNALVIRWNSGRKASPAEAEPARPADPGKDRPHLPAEDRPSEPRAILYAMKQGKQPYLTVPQAAKVLDCSESRILQWIHDGRIPGAIKPARDWLVPSNVKRPDQLPRGRKTA